MRAPDSEYRPNRWRLDRPDRKVRKRWGRWGLAVGVGVSLTLLVSDTVLNVPAQRSLMPELLLVELPMLLATNLSPFARDTWLTRRGLEQYDEFERAALSRATLVAYAALFIGIASLLMLLAAALWFGNTVTMTPRLLMLWAMGVVSIGFCLPALVAEWTVPFPDAED